MKNKVTIQDIADALGISRNTVSKAINNSEGLAEATRDKVLQKAVEMGYKQFSYVNAAASFSHASAEKAHAAPVFQGEIALFTTIILNQSHFASLMLDKFQREISQLGYTINTHRVTEENLEEMTLPITFRPEPAKAIICFEMFNREYDEMVCELGLPVLFVDGPAKHGVHNLPADQLYMDNTTGIARFVSDALRKGDRRIGFIGNPDHCESFYERYLAFFHTMVMAGVPIEEKFCIQYNHRDEIAEKLRVLDELPELFVCANDFVAGDAMRALFSLGKTVPEDVRILGFDDSSESRRSRPTISSVHIHTQIMAYEAVHLLISRIKEPSLDFRTVYTQTDLIERESTRR